LEVFKKAFGVSVEIHKATLKWLKIEQFGGMADQVRRASKSICANLAEGFGKNTSAAEQRRFVLMALGSAEEMRVWLRYGLELEYIGKDTYAEWRDAYEQIAKMLQALARRR
jgi:four helix bundle protein